MLTVLLAAVATAAPATAYRITVTPGKAQAVVARVMAGGERKRVDVERPAGEPFEFDALIIEPAGTTALNTQLRTWYSGDLQLVRRSRLYKPLPMISEAKIHDVKVSVNEEPSDETIAGYPLRKFVVRVGYGISGKIAGTGVDSSVGTTLLIWTTDKLDETLAVPAVPLTTGVAEVDAELTPKLETIHGFGLKTVLSITRVFAGGAPQSDYVTVAVDDVSTKAADAALFRRPADYVNQRPVISGPGK